MIEKSIFKDVANKNLTHPTKNKGITLIALVITIIVLLILSGVTINMVLGDDGIIHQAEEAKQSHENKSELERVKLAIASAIIAGEGEIDLVDEEKDNSIATALGNEFKEEKDSNKKHPTYEDGKIILGNGDTYTITTTGIMEKIITFTGDYSAIGNEIIASNGEIFYVIGADNEIGVIPEEPVAEEILLLAKYNLKKDENGNLLLKQDMDGGINPYAFCSRNTYINAELEDGEDANSNQTIISEATSALAKAKEYGISLGGTGELLNQNGYLNLKNKIYEIIYGQYESGSYLNYWLPNAVNYDDVKFYYVDGQYSESGVQDCDEVESLGVRPVIKISRSLIKK